MKKQLFALVICATLTTYCAFAANTSTQIKKQVLVDAPAKLTPDTPPFDGGKCKLPPRFKNKEEAKKFFEAKRKEQRIKLYDSLTLTTEQRAKAEELDAANKIEVEKRFKKVQQELSKLKLMKKKGKASSFALFKQKNAIKHADADLHKYIKSSNKEFENILTKVQKEKYDVIMAERKAAREAFKKAHPHKHPKFADFGENCPMHRGKMSPPHYELDPAGPPPPPTK